jgi:hypothetical protein
MHWIRSLWRRRRENRRRRVGVSNAGTSVPRWGLGRDVLDALGREAASQVECFAHNSFTLFPRDS